jgi:predicted TIM-barrel fold metal-dependent hydrolase
MLDTIRELRIPLLYHPERVALYQDFVPDYPDVNFILCHLGSDDSVDWREHLAGIQLTKSYPNVYMDTSAVIITPYLEKAIRELPAEKLIFGSDEADVDSRMEIYKIRVLKLPKEKEELILGGNIFRLLGGRL